MANEPWKALGISRTAYYKRRAEGPESVKVIGQIGTSANSASSSDEERKPWQFKPGQSGNPSGRPRMDKTVRALAREHTAISIKTLADIVQDENSAAPSRVAAAQALLDRGWGRPLQQIETGGPGAFGDMSDEDLIEFTKLNLLRVQQLKEDQPCHLN